MLMNKTTDTSTFKSSVPVLDLSEGTEMLTDFSREAQRHLISARNSLLVLESVPTDKEAIENVFKTFHTISGLADFLQLQDIFTLSHETETLLNFIRRGTHALSPETAATVTESVKALQHLLELLDEQISNKGVLPGEYFDITDLITRINRLSQQPAGAPTGVAHQGAPAKAEASTISEDPDTPTYVLIRDKLEQTGMASFFLEKNTVKHLIGEFEVLEHQLKEAQTKIQERQQELIHERELALKLTKKAQDDARSKSEYLANMSHEIRTLINAILGFTDLIKLELPDNSKPREHLNTIIVSGKMLLEIVNNILDFSKVEAGKLKLENIPFNIRDIAEEIFKIIRTRLDRKPVNLFLDIEPKVPLDLMGDPTRLKQIFMNLIDNAIKFTERGEIGLRIHYDQRKDDRHILRLSVTDTGIGIPEDRRDQVFDSFTQADASTTRLYGGTGLGLSLCRAFVEAMGGKIWIESTLGKGSQFIFTIGFKTASERSTSPDYPEINGMKAIIVSPFETTIRGAQRLFADASMQLMAVCQNPKQVCEYLNSSAASPDFILIDMLLPPGSAYELAQRLRGQPATQKIHLIAISSDVKLAGDETFKNSVFDAFLACPIMLQEMGPILQSMSGKKSQPTNGEGDAAASDAVFKGARILVAEDSIPNQELLKIHFESLGCICDYASNGHEAIEFIKKNSYQLCFMDLQMPVMGGLEAAQIIRQELHSTVPIVALTAAEINEERDKCLTIGMSDYLPKPFDLDQLKDKIKKFLT